MNNFKRITESPEKLAEWITECFPYCLDCPAGKKCSDMPNDTQCCDVMLAWLQEECDE